MGRAFLDFFYQQQEEQCNISMLRHICAELAGGFRKVEFHSIQGNAQLAGGFVPGQAFFFYQLVYLALAQRQGVERAL